MKPSKYQQAILDAVAGSSDNLIVEAVAGSGKTTTLKMICDALPRGLRVAAICFNKEIAEQFAKKLPPWVDTSTMHSLGLRIVRSAFGEVTVDTNKPNRILQGLLGSPRNRSQEDAALVPHVTRMSNLCLGTMTDPLKPSELRAMLDEFGVDVPDCLSKVAKLVATIRDKSRQLTNIVSFDDMIDFPVHFDLRGHERYDVILGDEVQDWNRLQGAFMTMLSDPNQNPRPAPKATLPDVSELDQLLIDIGALEAPDPDRIEAVHQAREERNRNQSKRPRARIILVGDSRQSIYAFRGADTQSMRHLKDEFSCAELPLSVCYRCPKEVVRAAQAIVGEDTIEWHDEAPEGTIRHSRPEEEDTMLLGVPDGTLVMCRCNAPLVEGALSLLTAGRKATIRGRDIGGSLRHLVLTVAKKYNVDAILPLLEAVRDYTDKEISKLVRDDRLTAAQLAEDKYECIVALATATRSATELANYITTLFSDTERQGVIFSTGHRAKGLEAHTAVIWDPSLIPHPLCFKSKNPAVAVAQEMNLLYVMTTRAMDTLIYQARVSRSRKSSFRALQEIYDTLPELPAAAPHEHLVFGVGPEATKAALREVVEHERREVRRLLDF